MCSLLRFRDRSSFELKFEFELLAASACLWLIRVRAGGLGQRAGLLCSRVGSRPEQRCLLPAIS